MKREWFRTGRFIDDDGVVVVGKKGAEITD